MTKNQRSLDSAVMMSSLIPSEKYSCSGSSLMLLNGSTAMAGRSGSGGAACESLAASVTGGLAAAAGAAAPSSSMDTSPMKRRPLRAMVRIKLLIPAAVADRPSRRVDPARQRRVRHDPSAPDRSDQVVLADDAVVVLHQVDQQVEHLRFDLDRLLAAAQFAAASVENVIGETKQHGEPQSAISPFVNHISHSGEQSGNSKQNSRPSEASVQVCQVRSR